MNTQFHEATRIQTHFKIVSVPPFPNKVEVYARNLTADGSAVLLGSGRNYEEALRRAAETVAEDHPGFHL